MAIGLPSLDLARLLLLCLPAVQSLEDPEERIGADIVMKALRSPCRAIAGACRVQLGRSAGTWSTALVEDGRHSSSVCVASLACP